MATYKWALTERGYKEVDWRDYKHKEYVEKSVYVEKYLAPCVKNARCGWEKVRYMILENEWGQEEYVGMFADDTEMGGRYICVTGDSLGSIACEVWRNVFN